MIAEWLAIKDWSKYQHYKDRCPPWIKLHASVLNDMAFCALDLAGRGLLMQLWVLASENEGKVKNDPQEIAFRLRITQVDLEPLISAGFLIPDKQTQSGASSLHADASTVLADAHKCSPETETETETEGETEYKPAGAGRSCQFGFEKFWKAYPKKRSKGQAEKAWAKIKPNEQLQAAIMAGLERAKTSADWRKDSGQFIPYPGTWLNAKGWEDEPCEAANSSSPVWDNEL